jgi:predicted  nucleic acid-binding Zn ribbon protein
MSKGNKNIKALYYSGKVSKPEYLNYLNEEISRVKSNTPSKDSAFIHYHKDQLNELQMERSSLLEGNEII